MKQLQLVSTMKLASLLILVCAPLVVALKRPGGSVASPYQQNKQGVQPHSIENIGVVLQTLRAGDTQTETSTGKSPFGLPGIFDSTLYSHVDVIPFAIYFGVLGKILEGTARKVALGFGTFHFLHALLTDYDGSGSLAQKLFGVGPALPIGIMYAFDVCSTITFFFLPNLIDGYTEKTAKIAKYLALSGFPAMTLFDLTKKK